MRGQLKGRRGQGGREWVFKGYVRRDERERENTFRWVSRCVNIPWIYYLL